MPNYQEIVAILSVFQGRPWNRGPFKSYRSPCYSMLNEEELRLLYWLGANYSGYGEIIDAGSFVGGSTVALASGLKDFDRNGIVRSFDRFICNDFLGSLPALNSPGKGASFRHVFEKNIVDFSDFVEVNQGSLQDFSFASPIDVLFLDCVKEPLVNDFVVENIFSQLIPGRTLVVQQDYLYDGLPWIHVTMELLSDYFLVLTHTDFNSVVFLNILEIPLPLLKAIKWERLSKSAKERAFDRAISKWTGAQRDYFLKARARI